ncbi:hypothetical protein MKEN_00919300 [Mycena kentingensis (nom. inval.)]|nr:hypothetical protein MKEN_00919300 [Mycena kentingensis (nom. inval.)]
MRFASAVVALVAAAVVSAQNQTITVNVGGTSDTPGGIFQFMPNSLTAANGSVITFTFSGIPGNHSVTQSTFAAPCSPFQGGFDSGWVEILANSTTLPEWQLTITNDQVPIWFYCKQKLPVVHCNSGMLGAINVKEGSANNLEAFAKAAQTAALDMHEGGLVGIGASASAPPDVGDGATLFTTDSATAPPQTAAPTGGSASGGASGASGASGGGATQTDAPGGSAVGLGFNPALMVTVLFGAVAGAALVF